MTIRLDYAPMILAQESHMQDWCTVDAYSQSIDSYGDILTSWTPSSGLICGVETVGAMEKIKGDFTIVDLDARVRLPLGTVITSLDRITVNQLKNVTVSGIAYEVKGIKVGPTCLVVDCTNLDI